MADRMELNLNPSVHRIIVLQALILLPGLVMAQETMWNTSTLASGGFSFALRQNWADTWGSYSSVEAVREEAFRFCRETVDYIDLAKDCTSHSIHEDTTYLARPSPNDPSTWYWHHIVNMYRDNGHHGTLAAQWFVDLTGESDCPTGQVIGPDGYDCVNPSNFLAPPLDPLTCNPTNPCNPADGNKFQVEVDAVMPGDGGLSFTRYYNSSGPYRTWGTLGPGWRHTYSRAIDERPDRRPAVEFTTPANESSSYTSASDACTGGWDDIKSTLYGGDLSSATATFSGGNVCKIQSGGSTVAIIPVRVRHQWSSFVAPSNIKTVTRPNGTEIVFELVSGNWVAEMNPAVSLVQSGPVWIFTDENDTKETYDSSGKLQSIEYRNGQTETLTYNATTGYLTRVTGQFGHKITFSYKAGRLEEIGVGLGSTGKREYLYYDYDRLKSVEFPWNKYRTYVYEDPDLPTHLTGIVDENGDRFATWAYDDAGRAISSEHGDGKELAQLAYNTNGTTTLTMGNGATQTYDFSVQRGARRLAQLKGDVCSTCPGGNIESRTYDSNGFLDEVTDWNGNITRTVRNSEGLVTTLTEAKGSTEQRVTTKTWHSTYRLPTQVRTSINDTNYAYDSDGNLTSITVTDGSNSRTWSMTYNSYGQVLTIDGPRTDVTDTTTFEYHNCFYGYQCGQLKKMTNALGQITHFDWYDSWGQLTRSRDTNGLDTRYYYDGRGSLTEVKHIPTSGTARSTLFVYDDADQLESVTLPNGQVLTYAYDDAHYLTSITDNLGNKIEYGYDAMGNLEGEDTFDPTSTLATAVDFVYDLNNRLQTVTDGASNSTSLTIDNVGNLTNVSDAASAQTIHTYDALNRLDLTEDALSGYTDYIYDAHDNLTSVEAPNGATTTYEYDDLDNLTREISPDRGTISYTHDAADNVTTMTDARGKVTTYTYDALNRLTEIELDNSDTIVFEYDTGTNA
ncbi:MAG: DUF6531 domain-containing protein, partial [Woeseiaceae bacterium]|nr:DUF6531 domain-containing protein [Woeseiaceae bacterium]